MDSTTWQQAVEHLCGCDPRLRELIDALGPVDVPARRARFAALISAIIGQQVSTKAARTIRNRLRAAAGGHLTAARLAELEDETLRGAGLSRQKLSYIRALCDAVTDGSVRLHALHRRTDAEVVAELTRVRGLGVWSAQMFLMFVLRRPDVMPLDDLGIQNAIARLDGRSARPTKSEMLARSDLWQPFRSVACVYLWRSLDATPE